MRAPATQLSVSIAALAGVHADEAGLASGWNHSRLSERGREVRDFLENSLGADGRRRSVVVVSTSDQSPLLRIRAALAANAVAEYFCSTGKNVLLVVDSLTRLAMAQRWVSEGPS